MEIDEDALLRVMSGKPLMLLKDGEEWEPDVSSEDATMARITPPRTVTVTRTTPGATTTLANTPGMTAVLGIMPGMTASMETTQEMITTTEKT